MDLTKGFYIKDFFDKGAKANLKQNIKISLFANNIIESDRINFSMTNDSIQLSTFINRIIMNFKDSAKSNIFRSIEQKIDELKLIGFETNKTSQTPFIQSNFPFLIEYFERNDLPYSIQRYLLQFTDDLLYHINQIFDDDNEVTTLKIRFQYQTADYLSNELENVYNKYFYQKNNKDKVGLYLRAILEEYSMLDTCEREKIYFKDTIDIIESAISQNKQLHIKTMDCFDNGDDGCKKIIKLLTVKPFKIIPTTTKMYNYLACFSTMESNIQINYFNDNESRIMLPFNSKETIVSLRVSRIIEIKQLNSKKSFLSKEMIKNIKERLITNKIEFLIGDNSNIKPSKNLKIDNYPIHVIFSNDGIKKFKNLQYNKPLKYLDLGDRHYKFNCTEFQARIFFSRMGADAVITKPLSLHNEVQNFYKEAYEEYSKLNININQDTKNTIIIKVKLDDIGNGLVNNNEYLRNSIISRENYICEFRGLEEKILNHICILGEHAVIISPKSLKDKMYYFFLQASKNYK